jgi:hypothetical protein
MEGMDTDGGSTSVRIRDLLRGSKDVALAITVRTLFNTRYRRIGEMTELSIDTKKQSLRLRLNLVGEAEPIEIHVVKYTLDRKGDDVRVTILDATASRQWLAEALREFIVGRSFSIPPQAGAVLNLLT